MKVAIENIEKELEERLADLRENDKLLEAQRLEQRTHYDLEMMREMGFCSGITCVDSASSRNVQWGPSEKTGSGRSWFSFTISHG